MEVNGALRLWYGEHSRNYINLYLADEVKKTNLAVVVHGGGFVGGSAIAKNTMVMIDFFKEKGFTVISIEYRVCPEYKWPVPIEDIAKGIKTAFQYLERKGIKIEKSIYIGSSAGAIAGAILIYAPPNSNLDISSYFDGFIGLSGGYCASLAPENLDNHMVCGASLEYLMPFNENMTITTNVPALLINEVEDKLLDRYAGQGNVNHQAECMKKILEENGVLVKTLYIPGGHGAPLLGLKERNFEVVSAIESFLTSIGVKTQPYEEGLMAYWDFDMIENGVVKDQVYGFIGTVLGEPRIIEGVMGNALLFDGNDDYVALSSEVIESIGELHEGSISLWFKFDYNLDKQSIQPIFYLGIDDEKDVDNMFIIEIGHRRRENTKLYVTWVIEGRVRLCFDSGFNLKAGQWYHLVVIVNGEGNTAYLNGVEIVERHYNFGSEKDRLFFADIPVKEILAVGYGKTADKISPNFLHFKGIIDEIRIYSRPLSEDEVYKLYEEGLQARVKLPHITSFFRVGYVTLGLCNKGDFILS